ncbi:MAG TPA: hypothetical protein VF324_09945 [Methanobacterium sp.]
MVVIVNLFMNNLCARNIKFSSPVNLVPAAGSPIAIGTGGRSLIIRVVNVVCREGMR